MYSNPQMNPFQGIYSWGWNNDQLGYKNPEKECFPSRIDFNEKIRLVAVGGSHAIIVTTENKVYTFGKNQRSGQLGHGDTEDSITPKELKCQYFENDNIISAACGDRHTVVVTEKGLVYSWGQNFNGQLGLGHRSAKHSPQLVETLKGKKIRRVFCGARHTLFLSDSGDMYSCGYGLFGSLGHGDNLDLILPKHINCNFRVINASCKEYLNVVLTCQYEVYQWGGRPYNEGDEFRVGRNCPVKVLSTLHGRRILQVAASSKHCLCRTSDGKVYAWGHSLEGLGYTKYLDNIIKSQEGEEEIVLTKKESKIKDKYLDLGGKYVIKNKVGYVIYKNHFFDNEKIVHVECGDTVNIALNDKGKVFVWGVGPKGELGLGKDVKEADIPVECKELGDKKITRIVSGYWHFLALSGENNNENRDLELPAAQKLVKKQEPLEKEDIYSMSEQVDPFAGKVMEE